MSRRQLFETLCAITTALEAEARRQGETVHGWVLLACVRDLDGLIDQVVQPTEPQAWGWLEDET